MIKHCHEWELVGDVMLTRTVGGVIPDEVYIDGFVADVKNSDTRVIYSLATGSHPMSSAQRKAIAEVLRTKKIPTIMLTESTLFRGVVATLAWLGIDAKAFGWKDWEIEAAVKRSGAPAEIQVELLRKTRQFRNEHVSKEFT